MSKNILHLSLKKEYFDQIRDGIKLEEYRELTPYWEKRLINKEYDEIHFKLGYPKAGDTSKIVIRPYKGYELKTIFGSEPVEVFAIVAN